MNTKNIYINFSEVGKLETAIMKCVDLWAHQERVPIPLTEIIRNMELEGIGKPTILKAVYGLVKKGYIRRSFTVSNKSSFVQLRRV